MVETFGHEMNQPIKVSKVVKPTKKKNEIYQNLEQLLTQPKIFYQIIFKTKGVAP